MVSDHEAYAHMHTMQSLHMTEPFGTSPRSNLSRANAPSNKNGTKFRGSQTAQVVYAWRLGGGSSTASRIALGHSLRWDWAMGEGVTVIEEGGSVTVRSSSQSSVERCATTPDIPGI